MAKSLQPCLEMSKSIVTLPWNKCYLYSNNVESQQSMSLQFCGHSGQTKVKKRGRADPQNGCVIIGASYRTVTKGPFI